MTGTLTALTLLYVCGLFLGSLVAVTPGILLLWCSLLFALMVGALLRDRQMGWYVAILVILLGVFRYQLLWQQPSLWEGFQGREVVATGVVLNENSSGEDKDSFFLRVQSLQMEGETLSVRERVLVRHKTWDGSGVPVQYGDLVQVRGTMAQPLGPANFGVFDYGTYLRRQGISFLIETGNTDQVEVMAHGRGNPVVALARKIKGQMTDVMEEVLPPQQVGLLKGFVFGERQAIEEELLEQLERSGLYHLLAVSGLHVGFAAGLALALGMTIGWTPRFTALVSGLFTGLYVLLVGFRASVLRAGIMLWVVLLGFFLRRQADRFTALSAACFLLLLLQPGLLFSPGFQLSFSATWGILYLFPWLNSKLTFLPTWLAAPVSVSLGAQLATWPILAYHFQGVAPWTVLANIVAVPLTGAIVSLGLLGSFLGLLYLPLAQLLGASTSILLSLFVGFLGLSSSIPFSFIQVPPPSVFFLIGYYGFLLLLPWFGDLKIKEKDRSPLVFTCLFLLLVLLWTGPLLGPSHLEVTFLAVGAGDAAVVRLPGGGAFLIDAGPGGDSGFDAGRAVVLPYLFNQGVTGLDLVFITHPHLDHWGGLRAIMDSIPVGGVVLPPGFGPEEFGIGPEGEVPIFRAQEGTTLSLGRGIQLEVLHPPSRLLTGTRDDRNNNSLVLLLQKGDVSFLFTGDLEEEGEAYLLREGLVPAATVLKVGHHGSRNSTTSRFLRRVRPRLAVVSTGPNTFGHPHRETLERLEGEGVQVFRTDEDGAVRIRTDGSRLWVELARKGVWNPPLGDDWSK